MGKDEIFGQEGVYSRFLGSWGFPLFNFGESEGSVAFPFSILGTSPTVKMGWIMPRKSRRILFHSLCITEDFWGKRTTFLRECRTLGRQTRTRSEIPGKGGRAMLSRVGCAVERRILRKQFGELVGLLLVS